MIIECGKTAHMSLLSFCRSGTRAEIDFGPSGIAIAIVAENRNPTIGNESESVVDDVGIGERE